MNLRMASKGRLLIDRNAGLDKEALMDWETDVVEGDRIDASALHWMQTQPFTGMAVQQLMQLQSDIKQDSGQNQFSRGETVGGVTAASAISALQEAGGKITRLRTHVFNQGFKEMATQMMWLINQFYDSKRVLYIASGVYSVCINAISFLVGYFAFSNPSNVFLTILFFLCMFLVGFQYGASNLLPTLFGADIIEEIEAKTGKRNDASYTWIVALGSSISGIIVQTIAPIILLRENLIGYLPHYTNDLGVTIYPQNSLKTALWMLAFYTIFHGICMLAAGIPFFFYDLTGKKLEAVHQAAIAKREEIRLAQEAEEQAAATVSEGSAD